MARIAVQQLTPGMRLEKPVLNLNGVLLLRAGEALTAKHIQILESWGVGEVEVASSDSASAATQAAEVPAEVLRAAAAEVAHRFRRARTPDTAPMLVELQRLVTLRVAGRLAGERPSSAGSV